MPCRTRDPDSAGGQTPVPILAAKASLPASVYATVVALLGPRRNRTITINLDRSRPVRSPFPDRAIELLTLIAASRGWRRVRFAFALCSTHKRAEHRIRRSTVWLRPLLRQAGASVRACALITLGYLHRGPAPRSHPSVPTDTAVRALLRRFAVARGYSPTDSSLTAEQFAAEALFCEPASARSTAWARLAAAEAVQAYRHLIETGAVAKKSDVELARIIVLG